MLGSLAEMARLVRLYVRGPDMGGGVGGLLYTVRNPLYPGQGFAWWPNGFPDHPQVPQTITQRYNLSNGRGDIVAQSDSSGALTWIASYEAYGKRTKETGANQDKQRANSKDEDPTGLLNEGFRYRDIETGVWLSRDPAGFVDGPNLYAYVRQNPWTKFDPHGLAEKKVSPLAERRQHIQRLLRDNDQGDAADRDAANLKQGQAAGKAMAGAMSEVVSNTPVIGAASELLSGKNAQGDKLSGAEQFAVLVGAVPAGKFIGKIGKAGVDALTASAQKLSKEADEIVNAIRKGGDGAAKRTPDLKTGVGYDAGDVPVRIEGQWSVNDMKQGLLGHPPRGLGSPDIHHGGQMPGGAKHEIIPSQHRNNPVLHPNPNQGVTPEMRQSDRQLHWWYRAREQGADQALPDWIYD